MKHDYKTIEIKAGMPIDVKKIDEEINKLGKDGWELLQVLPVTPPGQFLAFMRRIKGPAQIRDHFDREATS